MSWSEAGEIAFIGPTGISVLSVADGTEEQFDFGSKRVRWPHWVPGERRLTFTDFTNWGSGSGVIGLLDVRSGERIDSLTVGFNSRVTSSGHLLWADKEGTLWAAPMDTDAGRLDGAPAAMLSDILVAPGREVRLTVAQSGDLAYVRADARTDLRLVVANEIGRAHV